MKLELSNSRLMRWARHVTHKGQKRTVCRVMVGRLEEKRQLEDLQVCMRIILKKGF
jgi:hypothetical protein